MKNFKISRTARVLSAMAALSFMGTLSTEVNAQTIEQTSYYDTKGVDDTTDVSYSDSAEVSDSVTASKKEEEFTEKQEEIKNDVENQGGSYDYEVETEEKVTANSDINISTGILDVDQKIDEVISDFDSNVTVTEIDKKPVMTPVDSSINETFNTEDDAQKALDDFKDDISNSNGVINSSSIEERPNGSTITTISDAYTDLTYDEAVEKKESLETSDGDEHDFKITVVINAYQKDTGEDEVLSINKKFDTLADANNYLDELIALGYEITDRNITQDSYTQNVTLSKTFSTKEEADNALMVFKNEYDNASGTVTENRDESLDKITTGTLEKSFDDEKSAIDAANNAATDTHDYKIVATVRKEVNHVAISDVVTKTFTSVEEAEAYLSGLKLQGYIIDNYTILKEEVVYEPVLPDILSGSNNGSINNGNRANLFIRVDGNVQFENGSTGYSNDYYLYAGSVGVKGNEYYDINANKQNDNLAYLINNNNEIASEIVATITSDDIKNILSKYNINLRDDQVIIWYVLKDQNDAAVNNRVYTDNDGNKVVVNLPSCKYHIDGVIKSKQEVENIFKLTGEASKDEYFVDTTETEKGYTYDVEATGEETVIADSYTATATASKNILETRYSIDITKEEYDYLYDLFADATYDELTGYDVVIKSNTKTYIVKTNGNGKYTVVVKEDPVVQEQTNVSDTNVTNSPNTGDNTNLGVLYGSLGLSAAGIYLTTRKKPLTRKRERKN